MQIPDKCVCLPFSAESIRFEKTFTCADLKIPVCAFPEYLQLSLSSEPSKMKAC